MNEQFEIEQVKQTFADLEEPSSDLEKLLWLILKQENDNRGVVETSIDYAGRKHGDRVTLEQIRDAHMAHQCAYAGSPDEAWEEIARDHLDENHDNVYRAFPDAISLDRVVAMLQMDNGEEFIEDAYGHTHCFRPLDWKPSNG
ncbi:hypothetical protein [Streptomyces sp. CBMA29]|uniref:hypothetical protein n=1 Tax=Streptomyces sp. CBMA29 TaxID=1896314 RepID=UPI001661CAC6|nr:hypothetical protein [Streptomyces sp. CBMA29]MBD0733997.1 hypothetical protein [Streptomyces sp. CBMA29]